MEKIAKAFFVILYVLIIISCTKKNEAPVHVKLSVTDSIANFTANAETKQIDVTCNTKWTVIDTSSWCTAIGDSAVGTGKVTIQVSQNTTSKDRTTYIFIKSGDVSKMIQVIQRMVTILSITDSVANFIAVGETKLIGVTCNTSWIVDNTSTWFTTITDSVSGKVTIQVGPNRNLKSRTASLSIKAREVSKLVQIVQKETTFSADSIIPDNNGMRDITSIALAKEIIPGWNLGNSLDAIGGETAWGNPVISQRLIDSLKAAGFNAVRIPVAWSKFSDASNYTIQASWMDRVEEVVNYVLNDNMYAIINIHWDGGWMQPTYANQDNVNYRLAAMWNQIAVRFRKYGDHLLFAGTNEVMVTNNYSTPTKEYYTVQNGFNQVFVSTVRATGGCNAYRNLIVQGFNTNIDHTNNYFVMPLDPTYKKLMVEVHYYDPYNFTLNTSSSIIQWGKNATVPAKTETWANEAYADGQFQKMKAKFIDNGYPVILGEYGVIARLNLGSQALNDEYAGYRKYYIEYITQSLVSHGLVPFLWDNGGTGNNGMGVFNRSTGAKVYSDIIQAIVSAK